MQLNSSPVPQRKARIEIIPLIDVMFFLLASFMMVSLSLQNMQTKRMDLAQAVTAKGDFKPDIFNIGVDKSGEVSVGKKPITLEKLDELLAAALKKNVNAPIFVTADRDTLHGSVNRVLERVHRAGVQRVAFSVSSKAQ
ncbi:MAG TPA: biopolymer transporter ExbD [Candidatus Limnocylindria bacterium]|jgi:biopolymer transport protein ExbD|nr:biopolymer transporter ExbD [Candidatus Limnocylindria bacterium]